MTVSSAKAGWPRWYVSQNVMLAARVDESSGFRATRQDTLFNFVQRGLTLHMPNTRGPALGSYDVFPNGNFAVLARAAGDSTRSSIVALLHWQQLLKSGSTDGAKR